eukprot:COSAG05_NODE_3972_length_1744_cov_1.410942_2_plen_109_part_00
MFSLYHVAAADIVKDRGPVFVQVVPAPSDPASMNLSLANTQFGTSNVRTDQVIVTATHYARTQEALAEMKFSARQVRNHLHKNVRAMREYLIFDFCGFVWCIRAADAV